jgi:hypothetical protein
MTEMLSLFHDSKMTKNVQSININQIQNFSFFIKKAFKTKKQKNKNITTFGFFKLQYQALNINDEKTIIVFEATNADVSFSLKPNKPKSTPQKYKAKPRKRLIKNKAAKP